MNPRPIPEAAAFVRSALRRLAAIESSLLGWAPPPVAEAVASERWQREEFGTWCLGCGGGLLAMASGCRCARPDDHRRSPADERSPRAASYVALDADWIVRLGPYEEPLRGWLLSIKHHRWIDMASRLGIELAEQYASGLDHPRLADDGDRIAVVPMPMPRWRRSLRGIDHAAALARAFAGRLDELRLARGPRLHVRMSEPLRRNAVRPQAGRSAAARRRHGGRGFAIRSPVGSFARLLHRVGWPPRHRWTGWGLDAQTVILIDDVLTTGTSVKAAIRQLRALGTAKIGVAVVSVADSR